MSLNDLSSGVSAARLAMNPTPLGAAMFLGGTLASKLFGGMFGGKDTPNPIAGGTPGAYRFDYGTNGGVKPYLKANNYLVHGANADYNLLPLMGQNRNSAIAQLGGDPAAIAAYDKLLPQGGRTVAMENTGGSNFQMPNVQGFNEWTGDMRPKANIPANAGYLLGGNGSKDWLTGNQTITTQQRVGFPVAEQALSAYANKQDNAVVNPSGTFSQFIGGGRGI